MGTGPRSQSFYVQLPATTQLLYFTYNNQSVLGTSGKQFSIVRVADVQYLVPVLSQLVRLDHWDVVGQSFVFALPRFGT